MRNPFAIYTGSEVRILTTVNIHRSWKRRVQCFGAALLAMSMLAGCGTSQTAKQAESESTEEDLVLMEETLPQTAGSDEDSEMTEYASSNLPSLTQWMKSGICTFTGQADTQG